MLSLFAVQEQLSLPGNFLAEASSVSSLLLRPLREAFPLRLRWVSSGRETGGNATLASVWLGLRGYCLPKKTFK